VASDLFALIESPQTASEFYLASDTNWLYRWIQRNPAVQALTELVFTTPGCAERLASRALALFRAPVKPGFRTEHEPALCCYAFILAQINHEHTRPALMVLDAGAGPAYGWLRRLLDECLRKTSTTSSVSEGYAPLEMRNVRLGTTTPTTVAKTALVTSSESSFDTTAESWSSEDYLLLQKAA
jgi:hypothetical protein